MNAREEAALVNPENGEFLELDIFLPGLKLGFEFQVYFLQRVIEAFLDLNSFLTYNGL